jgi:hypothetical protein
MEIKYDGYRLHARIDGGKVKLLTRTGLDWSYRYRRTVEALQQLPVKSVPISTASCAPSMATACRSSAGCGRPWGIQPRTLAMPHAPPGKSGAGLFRCWG